MLDVSVREINSVAVLDLDGAVDISASELIETTGWLLKSGKRQLVLNFAKVNALDYSGLSVLAIAYKNSRNRNAVMKLANVHTTILRLFEVAKLTDVFDIYDSEQEALESFTRRGDGEPEDPRPPVRRRFKRLETNLPTGFTGRWPSSVEGRAGVGRIINLSGEGLFLQTDDVLPAGSEVDVLLAFLPGYRQRAILGRVVWVADQTLRPDAYPGMGIQFLNPPHDLQRSILDFIDRHTTTRSV